MLAHTILSALLLPALAAAPEPTPAAVAAETTPNTAQYPGAPAAATPSDKPLAAAVDDASSQPPAPETEPPAPPAPPAPPQFQKAPAEQPSAAPADEAAAPGTSRPPRFALGGSIGMNTISANGVQLLWRTSPHFGWAFGAGLGSSLLRYGMQGRFYLQPLVSSPYFALDLHGNSGRIVDDSPRHDSAGKETGETFKYTTEYSVLVGAAFGWHLVWGHFFLDPTLGWSVLAGGGAYFTDVAASELSDYDRELVRGDRGGLQLGVTVGLTW